MNKVAHKYCCDNIRPGPPSTEVIEAVYIITFSILMVNTDQHNVHVKTKMKKEYWVNEVLRSVGDKFLQSDVAKSNKLFNFTTKELGAWYDSIASRPLRSKEVSKEGKLRVRPLKSNGRRDSKGKERWAVLSSEHLEIYESSNLKKVVDTIILHWSTEVALVYKPASSSKKKQQKQNEEREVEGFYLVRKKEKEEGYAVDMLFMLW